jgi:hypothetical protein
MQTLPINKTLFKCLPAFGVIIILCCASCDPASNVTFQVVNESDATVRVDYYEYDSTKVTHIVVPGQGNQILFQHHFLGYVERYEQQDSVDIYYNLRVWKDSTLLDLNFNDKATWQYRRISKQSGRSALIIK